MKLKIACVIITLIASYFTWINLRENQKLTFENVLYQAENRILKSEIEDLHTKPTYETGYKDALIRMGGPQNPGAYQDGWDDAIKLVAGENGYQNGYHAAIAQFGYTKSPEMARFLVPEKDKVVGK